MEQELQPDQNISTTKDQNENRNSFLEILRFALVTLIIVIPIRAYVAQPFIVSGSSMVPTFENGEYLIIDELSYNLRQPKRGEVIVFRFPQDPSKFFIKRIIGLPGETVVVTEDEVGIFEKEGVTILEEPYINNHKEPYRSVRVDLKQNEYFVMGDNRDVSSDSRIWGPVKEDLIKGRVLLRLLPISEVGVLPGDYSQNLIQTNNVTE